MKSLPFLTDLNKLRILIKTDSLNRINLFSMQKTALIFFLFMVFPLGFVSAQETEFHRPEFGKQLELIFKNLNFSIPQADLKENRNLSDTTGIISNSIIYRTGEADSGKEGYYYWNGKSWSSFIKKEKNPELLVVWELDKKQIRYPDIDGSMLVFGIGGMEHAEFVRLKSDEKTLVYRDLKGEEVLISLEEFLNTDEKIKTWIRDGEKISFYDNGKLEQVFFNRVPRIFQAPAAPEDFAFVSWAPVNVPMIPSLAENSKEDLNETKTESSEKSQAVIEKSPAKKVREGREIKTIEDNEDGTFTITYTDGSRFTSLDLKNPQVDEKRELLNVINNNDGTFTAMFTDGSSLSSQELGDFYNFEGYAKGEEPEVDLVIDNGDGTYDVILSNGVELNSFDFTALTNPKRSRNEDGRGILSIENNTDGTYNVTFTDGTEINSKDLSDLDEYIQSSQPAEEKNKAEAVTELAESEEKSSEKTQNPSEVSQEIKIDKMIENEDGSFEISLTDGTWILTHPVPTGEEELHEKRIEEIIDNTDGTYTVVLSGGISLASVSSKSGATQMETPKTAEAAETPEKVSSESETKERTVEEIYGSNVPKEEVPMIDKEEVEEMEKTEAASSGSDLNSESEVDSVSSPVSSQAEIIVRKQREEIEALKRREKEKEEEIQEMKDRLKRLEELFDDE